MYIKQEQNNDKTMTVSLCDTHGDYVRIMKDVISINATYDRRDMLSIVSARTPNGIMGVASFMYCNDLGQLWVVHAQSGYIRLCRYWGTAYIGEDLSWAVRPDATDYDNADGIDICVDFNERLKNDGSNGVFAIYELLFDINDDAVIDADCVSKLLHDIIAECECAETIIFDDYRIVDENDMLQDVFIMRFCINKIVDQKLGTNVVGKTTRSISDYVNVIATADAKPHNTKIDITRFTDDASRDACTVLMAIAASISN